MPPHTALPTSWTTAQLPVPLPQEDFLHGGDRGTVAGDAQLLPLLLQLREQGLKPGRTSEVSGSAAHPFCCSQKPAPGRSPCSGAPGGGFTDGRQSRAVQHPSRGTPWGLDFSTATGEQRMRDLKVMVWVLQLASGMFAALGVLLSPGTAFGLCFVLFSLVSLIHPCATAPSKETNAPSLPHPAQAVSA